MARLRTAVERCRFDWRPWSGIAFRSTAFRYQRAEEILSGEGSRRFGGRWNPRGEFAAVYASLDLETAMAEALAHFRYYHLPDRGLTPRVFWTVEARLRLVLDLRSQQLRRHLPASLAALRTEDWRRRAASPEGSITQALGRATFQAGIEGLLVPSTARPGGINLVVFPANLLPRSVLRVERAPE